MLQLEIVLGLELDKKLVKLVGIRGPLEMAISYLTQIPQKGITSLAYSHGVDFNLTWGIGAFGKLKTVILITGFAVG